MTSRCVSSPKWERKRPRLQERKEKHGKGKYIADGWGKKLKYFARDGMGYTLVPFLIRSTAFTGAVVPRSKRKAVKGYAEVAMLALYCARLCQYAWIMLEWRGTFKARKLTLAEVEHWYITSSEAAQQHRTEIRGRIINITYLRWGL